MKKALIRFFAVVGAVFLLTVVLIVTLLVLGRAMRPGVPAKTILELDLETKLPEYVAPDPVAQILHRNKPTLRSTLDALERARGDKRVVGLVATIGAAPLGMAKVQELRDAIRDFRATGKFAVAFSETFGEVAQGGSAYYLATAFDEIWLQPSGDIGLTGILLESPFARGTLDKLGLTPRMDHRHEYKNAMNLFTEREFTSAQRDAMDALAEGWFAQMVRGIAQGRGLGEDEVRAHIDRGPFLGQEALEAQLVDAIGYRDEAYDKVKQRAGEDAELLFLDAYRKRAGAAPGRGPVVALVYGVGTVARGKSEFDPLSETTTMGSDSVSAALRAAVADDAVKAILFRVDSPGGSYVASDAIWRETVRARKAGKPVVVSMGNLAGSGGYFVAMSADKIVAQPGTITGSIGVLGGKFLTRRFWEKLGLTWEDVQRGRNARMWTGLQDYSPAEWERFQAWLDRVYEDFTAKVAEGRGLPAEKVKEIAKGRIWTGEDAKANGLVDELGGMDVALQLAKEAAGIPASDVVELRPYPRPGGLLEELLNRDKRANSEEVALRALEQTAGRVGPYLRLMRRLGLDRDPGVLMMPVVMP